tara:strand:+ start:222 stop:398 length:177 start_codon:yes stop_codon:yes gene_type:complete
MTTNKTITTTAGQTYDILSCEEIPSAKIMAYMVQLKNGKTACVYAYANGLVKKVTKGF